MAARSRLREWAGRALITLVSLLVSAALVFCAGEAYFQLRWDVGRYRVAPGWYLFDEDLGWTLEPGDYTTFSFGAFRKTRISINSLGLRDREVSAAVPRGLSRVTIVGDSFCFAEGLAAEQRFTEELEAMLGDSVEVVNVSAPSYGTAQEILLLERLARQGYDPGGTVVFAFFPNDVLDNMGLDYGSLERAPMKPSFNIDPEGRLVCDRAVKPAEEPARPARRPPVHARVSRWVKERAFYNFLLSRVESLLGRYPWVPSLLDRLGVSVSAERTPSVITGWYGRGWEERWKVTEGILAYAVRTAGSGGRRVAILYVPSSMQVEPSLELLARRFASRDARYAELLEDPERPQRALARFCSSSGIPLIDATPALREEAQGKAVYFLREGHLNEHGSRRVAIELRRWLAGGAAGVGGLAARG